MKISPYRSVFFEITAKPIFVKLAVSSFLLSCTLLFFVALPSASAKDANSNKASIVVEVLAESVKPKGTKSKVTQYADEQCNRRGRSDRLAEKRNLKGKHQFKPISIDADSNFIFQVSFEQKKLRQLKSCSSIANLELEAGHEYKVVYQVIGEVLGCSMSIYDLTAEQTVKQSSSSVSTQESETQNLGMIAYNTPELSCLKIGKTGFKNNVPVHTALELEL